MLSQTPSFRPRAEGQAMVNGNEVDYMIEGGPMEAAELTSMRRSPHLRASTRLGSWAAPSSASKIWYSV